MRIGISSYTYSWAIGVPGQIPREPLGALGLIARTREFGLSVLQIADNLPLVGTSVAELQGIREFADSRGVSLEVGTRGLDRENLLAYCKIAVQLGSPFVRVVVDQGADEPTPDEAVARLSSMEHEFRDRGLMLAIENHDRYTVQQLADIVHRLGSWVGICMDTVNSFAALDAPATVIDALAPLAINVHIKDFAIVRANNQMGFSIEGRAVGYGMLDVTHVLRATANSEHELTGIIELWTPPEATLDETIAKEAEWAELSVAYLRDVHGLA